MREEIPTVRILPMSDKVKGFRGLSIAEVQRKWFLGRLPAGGGRFHYRTAGLNAARGSVVLFQFQARIIASALFCRDEKFARLKDGYGGVLHFEVESIRVFEPVDIASMRQVWPGIRAFGHVKQFLNPALYGKFKKRLKRVMAPA